MLTGDMTREPAPPARRGDARGGQSRVLAALALLGLLAAGLLSARLATLAPLSVAIDDPGLQADGFYPPEESPASGRFRWSRPSAGFLLPALAARQVYTLELAAARPAGVPAPPGLRLAAGGIDLPIAPGSAWTVYTLTAPSQIGLGNALAIVGARADSSFYPGAGDSRHLLVAVRRVGLAPAPGPGGVPWPALLPGLAALLLPALVYALLAGRRRRLAGGAAALAVPLLAALYWLLPPAALPAALAGLATVLALAALGGWLWASGDAWLARHLAPLRAWRGARVAWGVALSAGFAGLAVVATWPLATRLGDALPGWPFDNFAFLYKIWWVKIALTTGANLFNDPHVFYPFGFNFGRGEPTWPNTIPGALLALLWGDAAGYNLVLLAGFVLSGLGSYLLARAVGAPRPAALLAGVIFMIAPYRLAQAAGHLQIAATQWIPFTLFFAERTLQRKRGAAPLAGLCYGLTALTAWYYALIVGCFLAGYVFLRLLWQRRALADGAPRLTGWAAIRAALAFALIAGVVLLPGLLVILGAARETPITHSPNAADGNSASLADYLIPNELQPLWGPLAMSAHADQNPIEDPLYLGLPVLALAGVALWTRRTPGAHAGRRRYRAWLLPAGVPAIWALLALVCVVLSLGFTLRVLPGEPLQVGGQLVPAPARLLAGWVPGFNGIRAYARFGGAALLAVTVLAALGATRLLAWRRLAGRRVAVTATLLGLVLLDFWSAPNPWGVTAVRPDAVAGWLAAQHDDGAVIRLPIQAALAGPPLYAGTTYGHPIAYGYETFEPPGFTAARATLNTFPSPAAFAVLRSWHVRYAVVAASSYGPNWAAVRRYFADLPDWTPVYSALQPATYQAPYWVGDARPDLLDAFAPDEWQVYWVK